MNRMWLMLLDSLGLGGNLNRLRRKEGRAGHCNLHLTMHIYTSCADI